MMNPSITITPKGAKRVRSGHPWVFRSDIQKAPPDQQFAPGQVVSVLNPRGSFLGQGFFNPISQISLRMVTRTDEEISRAFWKKRLLASILRRDFLRQNRSSLRLVHGESDQMPSIIVDQYEKVLVFQTLSAGAEHFKEDIVELLQEILNPQGIVERNDPAIRELEGLVRQKGIVKGSLPTPLTIRAGNSTNDPLMLIDPLEGQKTGSFLDQIDNHQNATRYAHGRALDLFTYQGGFALNIASHCDEVIAVDSSGSALTVLQNNLERNETQNVRIHQANAFDYLRSCEESRELFDTIILDPPPFVRDRKNQQGARRGYKEINLRAMKSLRPGGILITCSCSQNFTPDFFYQMLLESSRDTHRELQILEKRGASPDHPVLLSFPESSYLQCWVLRVI